MKKILVILALMPLALVAQTKKSGTVYSSHPALDAVNAMNKAFADGDVESYASYLSEDLKVWNNGESHDRDRDIEIVTWWSKNFSVSWERMPEAKADVIKYKGDKKGVWVFDWSILTAVNNISGDTVKGTFHDEYFVTPENKIITWISYYDPESFRAQIQNSFGVHVNGAVYDEHPLIDKVESLAKAYEAGNISEMTSYFSEDARFFRGGSDIDPDEKVISLEDRKTQWGESITKNVKRTMEEYGYPDAIRYEKGDGGWEVLSWWYHVGTDEAGVETREFIHLSHSFNEAGKITREVLWIK